MPIHRFIFNVNKYAIFIVRITGLKKENLEFSSAVVEKLPLYPILMVSNPDV
jgi:hypothetical protein